MDAKPVKPPLLAYLNPAYLVSLPERLLRALAAAVGGLVFQISEVALPLWVRRTRLYQALVYRLLRLTIELLGDVKGVFPTEAIPAGDLAVRKAVGNVVELAGFLAFGWSPLWILAAASDLTGGTRYELALARAGGGTVFLRVTFSPFAERWLVAKPGGNPIGARLAERIGVFICNRCGYGGCAAAERARLRTKLGEIETRCQ